MNFPHEFGQFGWDFAYELGHVGLAFACDFGPVGWFAYDLWTCFVWNYAYEFWSFLREVLHMSLTFRGGILHMSLDIFWVGGCS